MSTNCPLKIFVTILLTAVLAGGGVALWMNQNSEDAPEITPVEESTEPTETSEFGSLLHEKEYYSLPFGAAEVEGYYSTIERPTSIDESAPPETCSAFVVTDGPELLMNALENGPYGTPPTAVLGSLDSNWGAINDSTEENPVKVIVTVDPVFEGELVGCMKWPFSSFIEID